MIGLLLVSLTASVVSSSPPAVVAVPAPPRPPLMVASPPRSFSSRPGITQTIAVQLRQDGRVLWAGDMSRSTKGMASFNQQLRESQACGAVDNGRFASNEFESSGISVSVAPDYPLMLSDNPDADANVQITVERTRPLNNGDACADGRGNSTVRFSKTTRLEHGKSVTLAGESGLSVTLTLR